MILNANGNRCEVQEGTRSLLEVLRDDLGLVERRRVVVSACAGRARYWWGRPVSGCLTLAVQVDGNEILTVEDLA